MPSTKHRIHAAHDHICPSCGYTWHHKERRTGGGITKCPYPEATFCSIDCRIAGTPPTQDVYVPLGNSIVSYTGGVNGWSVVRRATRLKGAD